MSDKTYLNIPELIDRIKQLSNDMEDGKLNVNELTTLLDYSRMLNERIAILRYQAITKGKSALPSTPVQEPINKGITKEQILEQISSKPSEVKKEEPKEDTSFSFRFEMEEEESSAPIVESPKPILEEKKVQRSLLDQIGEANTYSSVNDKMALNKQESLAEKLQKSKIEDLRSVIGINQKFLFMNDLFEGEKLHYDQTIDKINSLHQKEEVENYLNKEVAVRFDWKEESESVKSFKQLIERKF